MSPFTPTQQHINGHLCPRVVVTHGRKIPTLICSATAKNHRIEGYDLVLSSGFLAFAAHCGFLKAVEDVGLPIRGIMGTSAGALIGSMFAAGYRADDIAAEFSRLPPIDRMRLAHRPWRGVLTLHPVVRTLQTLLPPRFEDLQRDFAVGVVGANGHELIDSGTLAEAVVASAAVPVMFSPMHVPGAANNPYIDGGVACRIGLGLWRQHRCLTDRPVPAVIHLIGRSSPFSGNDSIDELGKEIVCLSSWVVLI